MTLAQLVILSDYGQREKSHQGTATDLMMLARMPVAGG